MRSWIGVGSMVTMMMVVVMVGMMMRDEETRAQLGRGWNEGTLWWHVVEMTDLRPGDHIYSKRYLGLYIHHGIYMGHGRVIHFSGTLPADARIKEVSLEEFSGWQAWRLRKAQWGVSPWMAWLKMAGTAFVEKSDPPDVVMERARKLLNQDPPVTFSLFERNCEGFVYYCKTGNDWRSIQASSIPQLSDLIFFHRFLRKAVYWFAKILKTLGELMMIVVLRFRV